MNKKILDKVGSMSTQDKHVALLITGLLQFEELTSGWYKDTYYKLITKYCPEGDIDED